MSLIKQPFGFGAASKYEATTVRFDGTNDYMIKASDFTGAVDGKIFTCSYWVKYIGGDDANQSIFSCGAKGPDHFRNSANKYYHHFEPPAGGAFVSFTTTNTWTVADGWMHVLFSFNVALGEDGVRIYINDVNDTSFGSSSDVDGEFTPGYWGFSKLYYNTSYKLNCEIADFWIDNTYFDLDVEANRRNFIGADGKPVDLGATGDGPTGSAPWCFLSIADGEVASDWATNKAGNGNFAITGSLALGASSPSD